MQERGAEQAGGGGEGVDDPDDYDGDPDEAEGSTDGFGGKEVGGAAGLAAGFAGHAEDTEPVGSDDESDDQGCEAIGHVMQIGDRKQV